MPKQKPSPPPHPCHALPPASSISIFYTHTHFLPLAWAQACLTFYLCPGSVGEAVRSIIRERRGKQMWGRALPFSAHVHPSPAPPIRPSCHLSLAAQKWHSLKEEEEEERQEGTALKTSLMVFSIYKTKILEGEEGTVLGKYPMFLLLGKI